MASGRQTDEDLMAAVAHGSRAALRELYGRYERPLYQFVFRHGGGRDAEDLCQETWLRVVASAARFDRTRRFSTWLFQIAVNLCRDAYRRRRSDALELVRPERIDGPESSGGVENAGTARHGSVAATEAALDAERLLALLSE